jgi:primosomal protein N' (replication factor Y)
MTEAEKKLWYRLRLRQLENCKFRRQHPIGPYIADFACIEKTLIIEVDGGQHNANQEQDSRRGAYLRKRGFRILRFWNHAVLQEMDSVLEIIANAIKTPAISPVERDPHLTSPFQGEENKQQLLEPQGA